MTSMEVNDPVLGDTDLESVDSASVSSSDNALPKRGREALGVEKTMVSINQKINSTMATTHSTPTVDVKGRTPERKCPEPSSNVLLGPHGPASTGFEPTLTNRQLQLTISSVMML